MMRPLLLALATVLCASGFEEQGALPISIMGSAFQKSDGRCQSRPAWAARTAAMTR